ncbi:uncharacterized protein [Triticum aestivum]|uniref:uncharacterized protein n=1 Tax=Triticum aestivum TaxID=4565 RepID=UPI001D02801F|nr:uncharacterized protein LOC123153285 [Triticum aestivum]
MASALQPAPCRSPPPLRVRAAACKSPVASTPSRLHCRLHMAGCLALVRPSYRLQCISPFANTTLQVKLVLEEKSNGVVQEVSEIKWLMFGTSLSDSSHESQHEQD